MNRPKLTTDRDRVRSTTEKIFRLALLATFFAMARAGLANTVYTQDFEGAVGPEWSHTSIDVTPIGARRFLGQFSSDTVTLTLGDLPPHSSVKVSFDLYVINTWDGDDTSSHGNVAWGPDIWSLSIDRTNVLIRTTFDNHAMSVEALQSYPDEYPAASHAAQTGASVTNSLGYYGRDAVYHMDFTFTSSDELLVLAFAASLVEPPSVSDPLSNESWGLDNVKVEVQQENTVYSNDFESQVGPEWSHPYTDITPIGARHFLGQFCNDTVTLTLQDLPAHEKVRVSFDLFVIRSWDGDTTIRMGEDVGCGPDIWSLSASPGPSLLHTTFSNFHMPEYAGSYQSYPHQYGEGMASPQEGSSEANTLGYMYDFVASGNTPVDAVYQLQFSLAHSTPVLRLDFSAFGLQRLGDESWGLDNVTVELVSGSENPEGSHVLTLSSSAGGSVTIPGEGQFQCTAGIPVTVKATALEDYQFAHWTGTAVDAGRVADPNAADTTVTMDNDYTLRAEFEPIDVDPLLVAHDPSPADGTENMLSRTLRWTAGETAVYHNVYLGLGTPLGTSQFVGRRSTPKCLIPYALVPGTTYYWRIDEVEADGETIHPGKVWSFTVGEPAIQILTVASYGDGAVLTPGEGQFEIGQGTVLTVEAVPADSAVAFRGWIGSAVSQGKVADPEAARTTVLVDGDYALTAIFTDRADGPALGLSLGELDGDDPVAFAYQVSTNNTPETTFVTPVTGLEPDPNGMVRMEAVETQSARAKARFGPCTAERVLVQFDYLFESPDAIELIVYLSDVPQLLAHDDPSRDQHYVEIGRVPAPPTGCAGSFDSGRFGTFQTWAWVQGLDLSAGTWVELELVEAATQTVAALSTSGGMHAASNGHLSLLYDNLLAQVHCYGICLNVTWDTFTADWQDLALVMAWCGGTTDLDDSGVSGHCLEGVFSDDGYVDAYDLHSWIWALENLSCIDCASLCRRPFPLLAGSAASVGSTSVAAQTAATAAPWPQQLLVLGLPRRATLNAPAQEYRFYLFDDQSTYATDYDVTDLPAACNVGLADGPDGQVYLVNSEQGVLQLSDISAAPVIAPGAVSYADDPRYHEEAMVYIGIQGEGESSFGRPILDVAFDASGYAYVTPVVVQPEGQQVYTAAAKLRIGATAASWQVVALYDDPPQAGDNQYRNCLREIAVDDANNAYVLNVHRLNESCILWKYRPDGTRLGRADLTGPNTPVRIEAPTALHVSREGETIYLASGQYNPDAAGSAVVYGLSAVDFSLVRTIEIEQMDLVTSITEAPGTGTLWVAGFCKTGSAAYGATDVSYSPHLATIPAGATTVQAQDLAQQDEHNLVLPTSIVWTGADQ